MVLKPQYAGCPMVLAGFHARHAVQFPVGPTVSTLWAPDEIRFSKAPKRKLDLQMPLFQTAMFAPPEPSVVGKDASRSLKQRESTNTSQQCGS